MRSAWLICLRAYAIASFVVHLAWELLQLPLYTIWQEAELGELVWAVLHCTAGDVLIALGALVSALLLVGNPRWPKTGFLNAAIPALIFGVAYTVYSEWLNTSVRAAWRYTEAMPKVPPLGTGLAPLLQWTFVPPLALWFAQRWGSRQE